MDPLSYRHRIDACAYCLGAAFATLTIVPQANAKFLTEQRRNFTISLKVFFKPSKLYRRVQTFEFAVCFYFFSAITFIDTAPIRSLFRYNFNLFCHWLRFRLPLSGFHLSQALDILVSVRSIHCCTYTPDLSTSSSLRCLTRLLYERSHLKAGFTLRCFQRLSFPNVATQLYPWRDNWYTSGSSTPVLSY